MNQTQPVLLCQPQPKFVNEEINQYFKVSDMNTLVDSL